ncbi:MAG: phospho-N-acetylmuramoyl-pentapeptide-transferase [Eubacteriaceae bacterium]|nr:phospho-N-acetylmuramoyl-pentapeptide-transferase [Eubacteriaceae bacterium]
MIVAISSTIISFITVCFVSVWLIPYLRKIKFGQSILEIGPKWHAGKAGTPTMGGLAIVVGIILSLILCAVIFKIETAMLGAVFVYFALIGFIDDYIKVVKKRNLGLNQKQKLLLQFIGAVVLVIYSANHPDVGTYLYVPFYNDIVNFGWGYYPFTIFAVLAVVNAVNFTDGLDGLVSSVSAVVFAFFTIAAISFGYIQTSVFSSAALGACLGFLVFNHYPAKVFMGDTGSIALGGAVIIIAVMTKLQIYILLAGIIYVIEALSVALQISYFKYTRIKTGQGKRIFKMAPIHHHFEMSGLSEKKIVMIFTLITFLACVIAILTLPII